MIIVYLIRTELKSNAEVSSLALRYVVQLASRDLCVPQEKISIQKAEYGKPYIKGYPDWHFNISHTKGMVAIATSDKPVGIDIEKIKKNNLLIAERFFTLSENAYISNAENDEKDKRFLEIWTKKEAYIKFTGEGMNRRLNSFSVFDIFEKYQTIYLDGYILSVCASGQEEVNGCKICSFLSGTDII